jgi:hypothetical protein
MRFASTGSGVVTTILSSRWSIEHSRRRERVAPELGFPARLPFLRDGDV